MAAEPPAEPARRAPAELTITGTLQREAWLARVMPPVEQLDGDLWSIPVPIPDNPLRYVSAYAFGTGAGLVLIDTGWESEESWQTLVAGLASIGAGLTDVRGVLVTHMHFDHIGLAGRVRQASGAWVALHPADAAVLARPDYRSAEGTVAREKEFLQTLGEVHRHRAARPDAGRRRAGRRPGLEGPCPAHPGSHSRSPVLRGRAVPAAVLRRSRPAADHA
jgi:hypothetical protein